MISRSRRFDFNIVTVFLIVVIAALPFLTRPGLPRHTDLELHIYRAAEYGDALRGGVLYPRWAPDFYYGYGYPIFNYYSPLTYAFASLLEAIPAMDTVSSVKLVILVVFALGGYGIYFLARRHFGSTAGLIASAAFVLSPYFLFIDPLMRGDLAEFFALSLLPWVFFAFDRPHRFSVAPPLMLAALIFSHNLVALIGMALLIGYLFWRGLLIDGVQRWRFDIVSIGLGVALAAIFWLPFIAERNAVRLNVAGPGHFDYHNHFISLAMLLSPSPALDLGATTPKYIYNLGLAQWLLFIAAMILAVIRRKRTSAKIALFFGLVTLLLVFLITPASTFLWDAIPPAAFVQFPWRFLGPAAFTLGMSAGSVFKDEGRSARLNDEARYAPMRNTQYVARSTLLPALALLALFVSALPTMYPPQWDANFGDTTPRGMIDFELSGVALGTTSTGDFLPKPVGREPGPTPSLLDSYDTPIIDKFDHSTLPGGATVQAEAHSAVYDRFHVDSPVDFKGRLLTFLFPGWHVTIDGSEAPITPMDQSGFIEFQVPAGAHTIEAALQLTVPQLLGTAVSAVALTLLVALAWRNRKRVDQEEAPSRNHSFSLSFLLLCLAFLGVKLVAIDRCDSCFRYTSPPGEALGAQFKQPAHFDGHIDLVGYDLPAMEVKAGGTLPLTLYWRATAPVPKNYQVFAHLAQPGVPPWGQSDKLNPGDFPTTRWPLDKYVWDDHQLKIRPDTPPGDYHLSVGLYTLDDGQRLAVLDDNGQIIGDNVPLETIVRVTK